MKKSLLLLALIFIFSTAYSQKVGDNPGITAKVLQSNSSIIKIEYNFGGFYNEEVKINGKVYSNISTPGMTSFMEKGNPQIPTYINSVVIPDNAMMNYRISSQEYYEVNTKPVMPSKGHFTRDKDPNSIPYTFNDIYNQNTWYPSNLVDLKEPYVVRDLRGLTVQFNPVQYNPQKGVLRVYNKVTVEIYRDDSKSLINPLVRLNPFRGVSSDFAPIYRSLFLNYGMDGTRYDSIAEPGKMLVICPTAYMSSITQFVQWKQSRGLNVTVAEYPTATGTGNTAIKTYIQNMYNSPGSVTYIVLVGDVADIPTLNGQYESAPSDPCYVKLAGTDAYPDAFISRMSCQNAASIYYVALKQIKFERDILLGDPWFAKGTGIGGPDVGGTPPYADSIRMNWIRDTLMMYGFTQVDKVNGPVATPQTLITALNGGRYVLNYVGHGSGTSWSNTGFSVTNAYQLANGWKNPFLIDVACLNGNFTLGECLAEALLRAGDTANPKGISTGYASSTNASWVPPCDMQTEAIRIFAHQYRKSAGAIMFFGVMKGMDLWGGSSGEGLKLMEQYNIFGDCSLLLSRGVPLGPSISHNQLPNTENLAGPYTINAVVTPANAPLKPGMTKLYWSRTTAFDSITMTNTSGNNWTANIPGNGSPAVYKYYIKTIDTMNRIGILPGGAPANYFAFTASADTAKPVITHTALGNTPKLLWPATVTASATDNIGIDSVWVRWYINTTSTGIRHFKLNNTSGSTYMAPFNSVQADVNYNDIIKYRIFARDNSSAHNVDSSALYQFTIINQVTINIGTGTVSSNYPYTTYWMDGRTQILYLASEIMTDNPDASPAYISQIGFNVISASSQVMNGFNIRIQNTSATTINSWVTTGWTTCYSGTYTVPGTGWRYINLTTPFLWNGSSNLAVEICFDNTAYTSYSPVYATANASKTWGYYTDNSTGCTMTSGTAQANRPNISLVMSTATGVQNTSNEIPSVYSLSQNYPNPFNPVTRINFDIPKQGLVTMKIYDILGREVRTLVNEVKAPGKYSVDFNGTEFASGVYFYRLESNAFTDIKRMILIK
ncbi:MAG: T9SS type A sorting domain-containing protein [Ignavibacteriae bacterium]|nr:T9SS type A sorting domain-containing protein [Ignavibacteriota bacterium]